MTQSRTHSAIEALAGTAVGFVVSVLASSVVYPAHGHTFTWTQNISITAIFTVLSLVRGYAVRRAFNWLHGRGAA